MATTGFPDVPILARKRTTRADSDQDNHLIQYNRMAQLLISSMMPGCLTSAPGNKTGTSAATAWRTEAFTFRFRGQNASAAAQEKALTGTTHDVAASKEAWAVLTVRADGTTFTITQAADQTIGTVVLPTNVDNEVVVGYLQIVTGVTGFTAGTDDLVADGAKIASLTFVDIPHLSLIGTPSGVQRTSTT
jgi:hypothetical protein